VKRRENLFLVANGINDEYTAIAVLHLDGCSEGLLQVIPVHLLLNE
jgi:hypothetical protein